MKVTTLPETGKESKGHVSAHELISSPKLRKEGAVITEGVTSQLKDAAAKLGANCVSNLRVTYLTNTTGIGLEVLVLANAEAVLL